MVKRKQTKRAPSRRCRAVGYVRNSRGRQLGYSTHAQNQAILERSKHDGREFLGFYADEEVHASHDDSQNRPAFNQMMQDARAEKFDVLLVDMPDRLSRDAEAALRSLVELQDIGSELVSINVGATLCNRNGLFSAELAKTHEHPTK